MFELKVVDSTKKHEIQYLVVESEFDETERKGPFKVHGVLIVNENMHSANDVICEHFSDEADKMLYELKNLAYEEFFM